jgi:hypothetical protein
VGRDDSVVEGDVGRPLVTDCRRRFAHDKP